MPNSSRAEGRVKRFRPIPRSVVESMLWWPATIIQVLAYINVLAMIGGIIIIITVMFLNIQQAIQIQRTGAFVTLHLLVAAPLLIPVVWYFYVASKTYAMKNITSYESAIAACAIASLPIVGPGVILSIPFGIWGFVVLMRRDVRATFFKFGD